MSRARGNDTVDRVPPQNLAAEQAALGAMLLEHDAINEAHGLLHESDFYREAHRLLFRAITDLDRAGKPADVVTVCEALQARGQLEAIGGALYVQDLQMQAPTAAGFPHYAQIVRAYSFLRATITNADAIQEAAYTASTEEAEAVMIRAEGQFMQLLDAYSGGGKEAEFTLWYEGEREVIASRKEADQQGYEDGFRTPLKCLNRIMSPLLPGEMVVIAARPSVGKTSFAVQLAYDACASQGQKGLFVSLEMSRHQLAMRRLLAATGLSRWTVDTLKYRQSHAEDIYPLMERAAEDSLNLPLAICDTPDMTPGKLLHLARKVKRRLGGLDFIAIDYLQLLRPDERGKDMYENITEVSKATKALAKRLECTVIALAQLNRTAEGVRPSKASLRESGQIEQDADRILMLHWPDQSNPRLREIGIVKQRDGATDWLNVGFCPRQTWFYNSPEEVPE